MDLPPDLDATLSRIRRAVSTDSRFVGLAVGGSLLTGDVDEFSDLDLVVVVADDAHAAVMADRVAIAAQWGSLVAAFTGEHVGEPRLLVCLYDEPPVHVDLKFVTQPELDVRIEDPVVLWERDGSVTALLARTAAREPTADPQWIEDRFWIWIHYGAAKLGRGEFFETLGMLGFLRTVALAPLLNLLDHRPVRGVRRVERHYPAHVQALSQTVAGYDANELGRALQSCVGAYRELRHQVGAEVVRRETAERLAVAYLGRIVRDR